MVRWIAFMLCFLFILPAFADKKKENGEYTGAR